MKTWVTIVVLFCAASAVAQAQRPRNYPLNRWQQLQTQPDQWYRTADGKRVATNILLWQDASGGYAWYGNRGESALAKYAKWSKRHPRGAVK